MSEIKPIAGMERIRLSEAVPLRMPLSLFIFPTTHCNFKCRYCAHSLGAAEMKRRYGLTPQHMAMETFEKVVGQAMQFPDKLQSVSLTGQGEPMLNPHLAQMVRRIKAAGVTRRVEIISNASLLTHALTDALLDAGLDCLRISLQGMTSEKYRAVCGAPVDFDALVEEIQYFYERKGRCALYVKIMDAALDEGEEQAFYERFGPISDRMYVEQCRPVYQGVAMTDGMTVTADRFGRSLRPRKVCPLCFYMLGVFPDGDVTPCDAIYKPVVLGNVHQGALAQFFGGPEHRRFLRQQLLMKRTDNPGCAACCAPDDVSHPQDVLDDDAGEILARLSDACRAPKEKRETQLTDG